MNQLKHALIEIFILFFPVIKYQVLDYPPEDGET